MSETIHTHVGPAYRMNTWMGNLVFRHVSRYHAQKRVPLAPEPVGHFTHVAASPPTSNLHFQKPRENGDSLIPDTLYEAETLKPGQDIGQQGRAVLDLAASHIVRPVDPPSSSEGTARIWNRGRTFGGKIHA